MPFAVHVGIYYNSKKSTGKLYDGKGDANEKCEKKFRAFLAGFILFLALMFTVGSVNVKSGGAEAE